ncbi:hypothetical protein ACIBL8_07140 [Streptomyces sp. NPDC050523]|uniref:hypothetical protein n=1 Tax=Streptomyces sp. NPDC050523 TaxID=3365622 RepID=UPI003798F866
MLTASVPLYVPRALNHSLEKYGSLGAVFTLLSWLIALCVVAALCITTGAVVAKEPRAARHLGTPSADAPEDEPPPAGATPV